MEWREIITYITETAGISAPDLATRTGVSPKFINDLLNGRSKNPKTAFIRALVEKLNVDPKWILTGEGKPFQETIDFHGEELGIDAKSDTVSYLADSAPAPALRLTAMLVPEEPEEPGTGIPLSRAGPGSLEPICEDDEDRIVGTRLEGGRSIETSLEQGADLVYVDLYTSAIAGAGPGQEVEEYQPVTTLEIMRRFLLPWKPEQVKALEVRGDSMTKIGLFDRDIVLFVPGNCEGDGVFVISIEGRLQVKRLEFDILGKTLRIISENDRYQPRVLTEGEEISLVKIVGKVVGWLHRHPY